ncbi:FAD-linked oxidase C-terminal domain-containing protein [Fundidesulfovibrio butyratiphilus]
MALKALKQSFAKIVGAHNVMDAEADMHAYSYDAAVLEPSLPGLVIRPETAAALGQAVKLTYDAGLPITVRGAGTNLSGGTIPAKGGVVVLTNALNKILEINTEDLYAVAQCGVITAKFAAEVAARGLFYPPDPGSQAASTLGGNVAENAGGLRGLKYGVTKDYVMGVDFFSAQGDFIRSGSRTVKCVTGMNIAQLMVGSEGTLGVMSSVTFKLIPPPEASKAMMAVFDDIMDASRTVSAIIAGKVIPCTLEIMDNFTIRAVEDFARVGLPVEAKALLLIEVDGHPAQVEDEAAKVADICKHNGCKSLQVAKDAAERTRVWEARRAALSALARLRPTTVLEDATVPRSKIPAMMKALDEIAKRYRLTIGTFGHAGDGNLHPTILCDRRDKEEFHRVELAVNDIFDAALALDGTLSGEHGIGLAKSKYLEKETNKASVLFSRRLKLANDPKNLLNPGKILGD